MKRGRDYIVFALDVNSAHEAEKYVNLLEGKVGMFKIGLELFIQTGPDIVRRIRTLSSAGIFLDLKFYDISETVKRVMERVAELGVDLVTVHCSSSQKMLEMAVKGGRYRKLSATDTERNRYRGENQTGVLPGEDGVGVLGVTLLTDHDASVVEAGGFKESYVKDIKTLVVKRAKMAHAAGCRGVVCSGHEAQLIKSTFGRDFLAVTPGIRPSWSVTEGDDQQRITTPSMAVSDGADLIVIGRPIKRSVDPAGAAERIAQEIDQALEDQEKDHSDFEGPAVKKDHSDFERSAIK